MSDSFCSELLREMENDLEGPQEEETDMILNLQFQIIEGLRQGSKLLWVPHEQQLYYKNSFSNKTNITGYTCRVPDCPARVNVRADNTAYRDPTIGHLTSHGSQYSAYKQMVCEANMKQRAKTAPASVSSYAIYMEAVSE